MRKIKITDVIKSISETMTPEVYNQMECTLTNDKDLNDVCRYLLLKTSVVSEEYDLLEEHFKKPQSFELNYTILESLLKDENFRNAYGKNLQIATNNFYNNITQFDKNTFMEDEYTHMIEAVNGLKLKLNKVNQSDSNEFQYLKTLYAIESDTYLGAFQAFTANVKEQLHNSYRQMLQMELDVFTIYYLMEEQDIFLNKHVLKSAQIYLEKLETLYQNYKKYKIFDKLEIRSPRKREK